MLNEALIDRVQTWACRLPLLQPIDFGNFQVTERHYVCLRITTADGMVADCSTQTRGAPLDVVLAEVLAPHLLGKSAFDINGLRRQARAACTAIEFDGAVGRAWSLVEIALHDLLAQKANMPLWQLLGGSARALPVQLVEGYAFVGEDDQAFAERLVARLDEGYSMIKIEAAHYTGPNELAQRIETLRRAAGDRGTFILDFAWTWREVKSRCAMLDRLAGLGVEWIEDPFPRTADRQYRELRTATSIPVGCGDEATRPSDLRRLVEADALDVLRVDATTIGGFDAVRSLLTLAADHGVRTSFHEHPEVHEHCILGFHGSDHIEIFPTDRPFDRKHELVQACAYDRVEDGVLPAIQAIGTGIKLNDEAVQRFSWRHLDLRRQG